MKACQQPNDFTVLYLEKSLKHLNWFATSLATMQPLDSGLLHHQITSPWLLPTGRPNRVYQNFRLALVLLLMPLLALSSSFPASGLPLLILFPLPNYEGGVISVSEVCELPLKVHDILDNAVSIWFGNSTCILAHVFNSASRQHFEVLASYFPFLGSLKDVVPPSEACLYGHINWFLVQAGSATVLHRLVSVFSP